MRFEDGYRNLQNVANVQAKVSMYMHHMRIMSITAMFSWVTADPVVRQGDATEDASLQTEHVHHRWPARNVSAHAEYAHSRDTTRRKHVHEST